MSDPLSTDFRWHFDQLSITFSIISDLKFLELHLDELQGMAM